ncbi:unnamed protein product [Ectocarpus sp. 6 AP-2014]
MAEPTTKKQKVLTQYEQLAEVTKIVADTGEIAQIKKFAPTDATTNPSLLYKASSAPEHQDLVNDALAYGKALKGVTDDERVAKTMDKLSVNFGVEILTLVKGYVSTEVDARLSFDTEATLARARNIISLYEAAGVDKSRILIKIASTWEGIKACEVLQKEGITCNMTLLFALPQAAACAEAGATLISPFVGRILDYHKKKTGNSYPDASQDPGCISVSEIYGYYKKHGYGTIVMGASFRSKDEVLQLAGCDRLTIAPKFLAELQESNGEVVQHLEASASAAACTLDKLPSSESAFRLAMNDDPMATSKLAEGIRGFSADLVKLEATVRDRLGVTPSPTPGPAWAPPAAAAAAAANGDGVTNGNGGGGVKTEFDQLAEVTTIVADSGEIEAIRKYKPTDATTNPSLIYAAAQMPAYQGFVDDAVKHALGLQGSPKERVEAAMDKLSVNFGLEILKIVPGYVSTEVDARLSYDTEATVAKGRSIVALYKAAGIDKSRVLIKIASTWEGIRACEILQKEGISCNMTLLFCMAQQAVACAEAGATLISPFVGRITDWYKADTGRSGYAAEEDPGCLSVSEIFGYYKKHGHGTIVMGASFRNKGQILQLAGCDRLTIAPKFLEELKSGTEKVERKLEPETASKAYSGGRYPADLKSFRLKLNEDAMATEKLAEGIASFSQAIVKVEKIITDKIAAAST